MLGRDRQVRHQDEEVEQAAEDDRGGLFEETGEHRKIVSSFGSRVARKTKDKHGFTWMTRIQRETPVIFGELQVVVPLAAVTAL